jgi:N6-L-threonylcarbamoyladenine synthase
LAAECSESINPPISIKGLDCHFSGLQNQYEALLEEGKKFVYVAKYCLVSIAKTLTAMATEARKQNGSLPLVCAGGVMASDIIRTYMQAKLSNIWFASSSLSADNAVGVALIAAKETSASG